MAANNYFGFTHGGTQYSAQPTGTYPAAPPATYAVHTAHQGTYAAAPRQAPAAYDAYSTTHPTNQYAYSARQQEAPPPPPANSQPYTDQYGYTRTTASNYDKSQPYYQPTQSSYAASDTTAHYQAGTSKPAYTTNSTYSTATNRPNTAQKAANQSSSAATYVYPSTTTASSSYSQSPTYVATTTTTNYGGTYSGYDAAVYSAATMYVQQQQTGKNVNTGWSSYKKRGGGGGNKPITTKAPAKQPQLHYCDICKISCAGPQTYREHLEGQKHKKKEASSKEGAPSSPRGGNSLRCELCDVTCTGSDAYAAHIRGSKHQKVVKLHTKLGKPIPSTEPVVLATPDSQTTTSTGAKSGATGLKLDDGKSESDPGDGKNDVSKIETKTIDIQPVGQDYIEEIKNEENKAISFQCKLCECRFNDPNAKEMHMKGRRHRLQYKKKVNPDLVVDVKPSIRARKIQEDKMRRQVQRDEFWRRREEDRWRMMEEEERMYWEDRRRYEEELEFYEWHRRHSRDPRAVPPRPHPQGAGVPHMRRIDTSDDRHVMAKHTSIYPIEGELQAVQTIVSNSEKALKLVSDHIAECDNPKTMENEKSEIKEDEKKDEKKEEKKDEKKEDPNSNRALKGVMRVGVLAKGLLLHGDLNVHLVVLCSEKPTRTLLVRVADALPKQLATVTEEKYDLKLCVEEASIILASLTEPKTSVTVTLTSPVMREAKQQENGEGVNVKDPPDVLDRQKCLDALAALRHAKWFQARANGLQSCVIVIRILRDLCQRVPTWGPLNSWAMELLVEKVISSAGTGLSPGDALRRVFGAIASGILLPGGPGLMDPCEKEPTDAASALTNQEREDIASSAQHALRLLAFRQIHKVLGMDPLPTSKFPRQRFNPRKRRRDNSSGEPGEEGDGKKDKKEGDDAMEMNETQANA